MTTITADSVIQRTREHLDAALDDELIVMHIPSGQIYGMAYTATEIWNSLAEPVVFGKLIDQLVGRYDIDPASCAKDVSRFLLALQKQDLAEITPSPVRAGRTQ